MPGVWAFWGGPASLWTFQGIESGDIRTFHVLDGFENEARSLLAHPSAKIIYMVFMDRASSPSFREAVEMRIPGSVWVKYSFWAILGGPNFPINMRQTTQQVTTTTFTQWQFENDVRKSLKKAGNFFQFSYLWSIFRTAGNCNSWNERGRQCWFMTDKKCQIAVELLHLPSSFFVPGVQKLLCVRLSNILLFFIKITWVLCSYKELGSCESY